ncbi:sorting nexin 2A [Selaginella moellendorffii]|nr:sorting nexin 2A [Selaginella moellendorffii]|eukprot:XP_002978248.2 sorting nexin 2A [Selaginella moellendorffii]
MEEKGMEECMEGMESISLDKAPLAYFSSSDYRSAMAASGAMSPSADQEDDEDGFLGAQSGPEPDPRVSDSSKEVPISRNGGNSSQEFLTMAVTQPQKIQESTGSSLVPNIYVTYLVVSHTNIPEYGGTEFSVRRRFRDFVTLADRLALAYRGYFIPPRPDKSIVESQVMQKQEFIEQRRVALEKYLSRLAAHPVLRKSEELRLFLQTNGKLPLQPSIDMASRMLDGAAKLPKQLFGDSSTVLAPQEASQPAKGGRDLIRIFKELRQSVTNDWGASKPPVVEEDKEFLEKKEKLQDLELELTEASQQAEALIKAQQEVGDVVGDLGLALIRIGKYESQEATGNAQKVHATDVKRLATAAVKVSRFYKEFNAESCKHLDHLHDYLGLMQSVHTAFSDRSSALLTLQTLMTDLSAMHARIEKLNASSSKTFGGDRSSNRKVEELNDSIKTAEKSRDKAQEEYERIKERNRSEIENYECDRQRDFFSMLKGFVQTQVTYNERIASVWSKAFEEAGSASV